MNTHPTKTYEGRRGNGAAIVTVNRRPLPSRLDLRNHSPEGFEWGYNGSGPAQLSLALLSDYLGDSQEALELYQELKRAVVAGLPHPGWTLTDAQMANHVGLLRQQASDTAGIQRD